MPDPKATKSVQAPSTRSPWNLTSAMNGHSQPNLNSVYLLLLHEHSTSHSTGYMVATINWSCMNDPEHTCDQP